MQVKVCPKCKAENRATNAACSRCYASLDGVAITEGSAPPPIRVQNPPPPRAPKPSAPARPAPPGATMPPGPAGPVATQQMPPPQQTQMGPPGTMPPPGMPPHYGIAPVKKKSMAGIVILIVVLVIIVFGGIGFAVLQSGIFKPEPRPAESAEAVAMKFLEAKKSRDFGVVKPYLSQNSIDRINGMFGSRQAQSAGFGTKDASDMILFSQEPTPKQMLRGGPMTITELKEDKEADNKTAIVKVHIDKKPDASPGAASAPEGDFGSDLSLMDFGPVDVEIVLVAENGHWKYDIGETDRRASGEAKPDKSFKFK